MNYQNQNQNIFQSDQFAYGTKDPNNLKLPFYGVGFKDAVVRFVKNTLNFKGRASKSEYWYAMLFSAVIMIVLFVLPLFVIIPLSMAGSLTDPYERYDSNSMLFDGYLFASLGGYALLLLIVPLALLIPVISITWRRLQDADLHGAFSLLIFAPYIGSVVQIIAGLLSTNPSGRRFDDPAAQADYASQTGLQG